MYYAGRKTFKDRLQRYNPLLFTTKFYLIYFTVSGGRDRCVVVVKIKNLRKRFGRNEKMITFATPTQTSRNGNKESS